MMREAIALRRATAFRLQLASALRVHGGESSTAATWRRFHGVLAESEGKGQSNVP